MLDIIFWSSLISGGCLSSAAYLRAIRKETFEDMDVVLCAEQRDKIKDCGTLTTAVEGRCLDKAVTEKRSNASNEAPALSSQNANPPSTVDHKLISTFDTLDMGVVISDMECECHPVIFVNEAFCNLLELQRDDLLGKCWEDVFKIFENIVQSTSEGGMQWDEPSKQDGCFYLEWDEHADQVHRWHSFDVSPVHCSEGKPLTLIGIQRDITDLVIRERQINQSQKLEALGQLAGGVAHDFNNVLSIIDGYAKMGRMALIKKEGDVLDTDKVETFLDRISQSASRGASLTRQLLTFGRHKIVGSSKVNLGSLVQEQEKLLLPLMGAYWELNITSQDDLFIEIAPDSISQIVMNLVINARDAMPDGGEISLSTTTFTGEELPRCVPKECMDTEYVCLAVSDKGTGIKPDVLENMFDPFFTTKTHGQGTGLGLSMIYGLVKQARGFIDVKTQLGEGTTFTLYFPQCHEKKIKSVTSSPSDLTGVNFQGFTACVAEDEEDLLFVMSSMLEEMGIHVLQARNGNEALHIQDDYEDDIDFLITDIMMPEMNGVRLAELFSSLRPETKMIFVSGYPSNPEMPLVSLPEGSPLLAKPIEYDKMARVLIRLSEDAQIAPCLAEVSRENMIWEDKFLS